MGWTLASDKTNSIILDDQGFPRTEAVNISAGLLEDGALRRKLTAKHS